MFGANRSGFDWKEIAEVLRVTTAAPATFWREVRYATSKKVAARSPATAIQEQRDPATRKLGKPEASR